MIYLILAASVPLLVGALSICVANWAGRKVTYFGGLLAALVAISPSAICGILVWTYVGGIVDEMENGPVDGDFLALAFFIGLAGLLSSYMFLVGIAASLIAYFRHQRWESARGHDDA